MNGPNKHTIENGEIHKSDICIIGSGMCGQIIANKLSEKKKKITIIESGKFTFDKEIQNLNNFTTTGLSLTNDPNESYKDKNVRQFGGSANHWGNQIMFFKKNDLEDRPWISSDLTWEITYEELKEYYQKVLDIVYKDTLSSNIDFEDDINVKYSSFFDKEFLTENIFDFTSSYHPKSIEKFNYKSKFSGNLISSNNIKVFTEATATKLNFIESKNSLKNIEICSNQKTFRVESKIFILCAGAIENAKILLNNSKNNLQLKNELIGKYFMEHPIINIGYLALNKKIPLSNLLGIRGKKYNFRKALRFSESFQKERQILNSHLNIHPIFRNDDIIFFNKILLQIKNLIKLKKFPNQYIKNFSLNKLIEQIYFAPHRITNTYLNNLIRIYFEITKHAFSFENISLDYHGEQAPNINSRIYLNDTKDIYDQNTINIEWKLSDLDHLTKNHFTNYFKGVPSKIFTFIENKKSIIINQKHQMGTTRMGKSKRDGVVDKNCKVFDISNLYVSGGSVFRTSGSSNPGITEMALSLRLAEYINKLSN